MKKYQLFRDLQKRFVLGVANGYSVAYLQKIERNLTDEFPFEENAKETIIMTEAHKVNLSFMHAELLFQAHKRNMKLDYSVKYMQIGLPQIIWMTRKIEGKCFLDAGTDIVDYAIKAEIEVCENQGIPDENMTKVSVMSFISRWAVSFFDLEKLVLYKEQDKKYLEGIRPLMVKNQEVLKRMSVDTLCDELNDIIVAIGSKRVGVKHWTDSCQTIIRVILIKISNNFFNASSRNMSNDIKAAEQEIKVLKNLISDKNAALKEIIDSDKGLVKDIMTLKRALEEIMSNTCESPNMGINELRQDRNIKIAAMQMIRTTLGIKLELVEELKSEITELKSKIETNAIFRHYDGDVSLRSLVSECHFKMPDEFNVGPENSNVSEQKLEKSMLNVELVCPNMSDGSGLHSLFRLGLGAPSLNIEEEVSLGKRDAEGAMMFGKDRKITQIRGKRRK